MASADVKLQLSLGLVKAKQYRKAVRWLRKQFKGEQKLLWEDLPLKRRVSK